MSQAGCFACLAMDQLQMVIASLLCQILKAQNPMADCSVSTLLEQAKCFAGCASPAQLMMIQTQLLCEILAAGGGGGGGSGVTCLDASDPVDPPITGCGIAYRKDNGSIFIWDGSTWVLRIA